MKVEQNTICYTSEKGHNNFWYPTQQKLIVTKECDVQKLTWISGGSKIAIRILKENLIPLDISEKAFLNVSPPTKNEYTIVWIEKCFKN